MHFMLEQLSRDVSENGHQRSVLGVSDGILTEQVSLANSQNIVAQYDLRNETSTFRILLFVYFVVQLFGAPKTCSGLKQVVHHEAIRVVVE